MSIILLVLMLLMHVLEDFHIQGRMADMKQQRWWSDRIYKDVVEHNPTVVPEGQERMYYDAMRRYGNDYLIVLVLHAFEWAVFIHLPIILACFSTNLVFSEDFWLIITISIMLNTLIHTVVDDAKANRGSINLIVDQLIHITQVIATFIVISLLI